MPKKRRLLILPQAEENLEAIYEPLWSEVVARLQLLRQFPEMGCRMGGRYRGWRATTVGLFRIIYRLSERGVEVGYVRHCKRALPRPLSK